jgi:hypothetical protein
MVARKKKGCLSQTVSKQHSSTLPHTAKNTLENIRHLKFELLELLRYSWYPAPSDFHMLRPLKTRYFDCEEKKNAAHSRLCGCSLITKLVERFSLVQTAEESGRAAGVLRVFSV